MRIFFNRMALAAIALACGGFVMTGNAQTNACSSSIAAHITDESNRAAMLHQLYFSYMENAWSNLLLMVLIDGKVTPQERLQVSYFQMIAPLEMRQSMRHRWQRLLRLILHGNSTEIVGSLTSIIAHVDPNDAVAWLNANISGNGTGETDVRPLEPALDNWSSSSRLELETSRPSHRMRP